jgi:hypothetical protein
MLDIFRVNPQGSLLLLYVSGGQQQSIGENTPSSSGNVYVANGQTERILVPYTRHILLMVARTS